MTWRGDHNWREGVTGGGDVRDRRRGGGDGLGRGEEPHLSNLRVADRARRSASVHLRIFSLDRGFWGYGEWVLGVWREKQGGLF